MLVAASPWVSVKDTPSSAEAATSVITSAVAIRVLLGTQSVSTADPPRPSVSTSVTSAPSCAAPSADSYPPGPPPLMTTRFEVGTGSEVDHVSGEAVHCFLDRLGQRRVGEHIACTRDRRQAPLLDRA